MNTRPVRKTRHRPEEAFLENNPTISPTCMCDCIYYRTNAIIDCLNSSLEHIDHYPKEKIQAVLSQVTGNLELLQRITDMWQAADLEGKFPGQTVHSLRCETKGLIEDSEG